MMQDCEITIKIEISKEHQETCYGASMSGYSLYGSSCSLSQYITESLANFKHYKGEVAPDLYPD